MKGEKKRGEKREEKGAGHILKKGQISAPSTFEQKMSVVLPPNSAQLKQSLFRI